MGRLSVISTDVPAAAQAAATATAAVGFVVLGIPQAVLVAALLGSMLSFYFTDIEVVRRIPRLIFGVIAISFSAGWTAQALPYFEPTRWTGDMPPQALAGLLGLSMQFGVRIGSTAITRFANRKAEEG